MAYSVCIVGVCVAGKFIAALLLPRQPPPSSSSWPGQPETVLETLLNVVGIPEDGNCFTNSWSSHIIIKTDSAVTRHDQTI